MAGKVLSREEFEEVKRLNLDFIVVPCLNENGIDGDKLKRRWDDLIATVEYLLSQET